MAGYKVRGPNDDGVYEVVNGEGEVKSEWATEEEAKDQVKILHDIEERMAAEDGAK